MRTVTLSVLLVAAAGFGWAQQWEFGGAAGAGFLSHVGVSSALGSATAGFKTGPTLGAFVGQNLNAHLSGELHYDFMQNNLHLSSGGSDATFSGQAHLFHYDFVYHTHRRGKKEFFLAAGGGMKVFVGTGAEQAYQPLSQFGYFTKTHALKPMVTVGAGVRYAVGDNLYLRMEIRDYLTGFPTSIIAPAPGTTYGSILNDFVPSVGISFLF
jgi:hypothetical protein